MDSAEICGSREHKALHINAKLLYCSVKICCLNLISGVYLQAVRALDFVAAAVRSELRS